jgi:hypothetical protein
MSAWWLIVAFLAGWFACWYLSKFLLGRVLRHPAGSISSEVIAGLKQENLLKFRDAVESELAKRRSS